MAYTAVNRSPDALSACCGLQALASLQKKSQVGHFYPLSIFPNESLHDILCLKKTDPHHLLASTLSSQQGEGMMVLALIL